MGATSCQYIDSSQGSGPLCKFDVNNQRDILAHYDDGTEKFALMSNGFIRTASGWKYRYTMVGLGDIAADNDDYTYPLLRCKHDITITHCAISAGIAVTANSTNYQTIYLEQTGNSTDLSTLTTASTGITQGVPRDFTIATTGDPDHLAAGDTLTLRFAQSGSGVAMYGVTISITYTIDQPWTAVGTSTDNVVRFINDIGSTAVLQTVHAVRDHFSVCENGVEKFRIDNAGKMHGAVDGSYPADMYYYHVVNAGDIENSDTFKIPLFNPHCAVKIHNIYIGASQACAVDSNSAYWQLIVKDDSGNELANTYVHGPYGSGLALSAGYLYSIGEINKSYQSLDAAEHIQMELTETGTAATIYDLTIVVAYTKET